MAIFVLPPTIADNAKNSQGSESKIDNPFVERFSGTLSQLLGSAGANGTLGLYSPGG
jgi:hypothetical protein